MTRSERTPRVTGTVQRWRWQNSFAKRMVIPIAVAATLAHTPLPALAAEPAAQQQGNWAREYLASISPEYARHVLPTQQPLRTPVDEFPQLEVQWVEVVRKRLDEPQAPPPVVPPGLESLAWAAQNPTQAWRIVLPIPSEQTPQLSLPAHPRAEEISGILVASR